MDIDSFYQDGDMSFGMDGRIAFSDENQFLRADGGRQGEVNSWYPVSEKCEDLENTIAKAKTDVANNMQKLQNPKIKRGEKRVLNDYNSLINKRIGQLEDKYRRLGCALKKKTAEEGAFVDTLKQIAAPQGAADAANVQKTSNTTKYLLYGMGGLVLLAGIFVVVKKMKG